MINKCIAWPFNECLIVVSECTRFFTAYKPILFGWTFVPVYLSSFSLQEERKGRWTGAKVQLKRIGLMTCNPIVEQALESVYIDS